jgi:hypothetical protein
MLADDLDAYFDLDGFAEVATVAGVDTPAIFSSTSPVDYEVVTQGPTLQMPATVSAAPGDAVTVRGTSYSVRQVIDQAPDAAVRLLVLVRA